MESPSVSTLWGTYDNAHSGSSAAVLAARSISITATIVGMTRPERLAQTVELARHAIPDNLWAQLEAIAIATEQTSATA